MKKDTTLSQIEELKSIINEFFDNNYIYPLGKSKK